LVRIDDPYVGSGGLFYSGDMDIISLAVTVAVTLGESLVNRHSLDAAFEPLLHDLAVGFDRRGRSRRRRRIPELRLQDVGVREWVIEVEVVFISGEAMVTMDGVSGDAEIAGDEPFGLTETETVDDVLDETHDESLHESPPWLRYKPGGRSRATTSAPFDRRSHRVAW
jgi:hypothetical protein